MTAELAWMVGLRFGRVDLDEQSGRWWFPLKDGFGLALQSPWQILAEGRVAVASGDHGQPYGLPAPIDVPVKATLLLRGRPVRSVSLAQGSSELEIELEGGVALRTFNDSSGYEGWDLCGPGGGRWVCQGGGTVCRIVIDGESHSRGAPVDG